MEQGEIDQKEVTYNQWAEEWNDQLVKGQLTHIQAHPSVGKFVKEGQEAIPFILKKLLDNRLWYIPLEKIIYNEFDERIEPHEEEIQKPVSKDPLDAKFAFLEGHRTACVDWAIKNGCLPKGKE
jgi:hypothetical protein